MSCTCPMISDLHIKKLTTSCQEVYQMTVLSWTLYSLPVKNHLFLDVSSDDLYSVGGDRE